jgi:hypothetical protein
MAATVFTNGGHFEESEALLVWNNKVGDHVNYLHMINHVALNKKQTAIEYNKKLLESFTFSDLPRRHRMLTEQIAAELELWDQKGLDDIVRDMKQSANRLSKAKGGRGTQEIQEEIVRKLDRKIKQEEEKLNQASKINIPVPTAPTPAQDSQIMGGMSSKGVTTEKELKRIAESWGGLPPAKRKQVIEDLTRTGPEKYRIITEEYHKSLNKLRK